MAVVIETTLGDMTVDLFTEERPTTCLNFLKLCKVKYYNFCLFHSVQHNFIAQTGDPTGSGNGGESIFTQIQGDDSRYYQAEMMPKLKHYKPGLVSMVNCGNNMLGSQFFFTLGGDLQSLDNEHCIFGEVSEGFEVLQKLNEAICDTSHRPYQDIRITHTVILEDPFDDPPGLQIPSCSPELTQEMLKNGRIAPDEVIDETAGLSVAEVEEMQRAKEAAAQATILEIVGDLPDADVAPPENVLFVCKLNPVTTDDDLEVIFSRFGKVKSCEVIRDKKTGDSLQYAFVEFEDAKACELAYFKMDNVLIDDRRIHVDFSQSVSKLRWKGKGRGVEHVDDSNMGKGESDDASSGRKNYTSTGSKTDHNQGSVSQTSKKGSNDRDNESYRSYSHRSSDSRRDRYDDRRRGGEHSSERDRNSHSGSRREDSGEQREYSHSRDKRDRRDKDRRDYSYRRDEREDKRRRDEGSGDRSRKEDSSRREDDKERRDREVRHKTEAERGREKYHSSRSKREDRKDAELREPDQKIVYEYKSDVKSDETQSEGLSNEKIPDRNEVHDRKSQKSEHKETLEVRQEHSSEHEQQNRGITTQVVSGEKEERHGKDKKQRDYESKGKQEMNDKSDKHLEVAVANGKDIKEKHSMTSSVKEATRVSDNESKHHEETKAVQDSVRSSADVEKHRQKESSERTKNNIDQIKVQEEVVKDREVSSESSDEDKKKKSRKSKKEIVNDVKKIKKHEKTKKIKDVESESSDDHKSSKKKSDLLKNDKISGITKNKSRSSSKSVEKKIKRSGEPSPHKEKHKDRSKHVPSGRKKKRKKVYTSSSSEDEDSSSSSETSSDSLSDSSDSEDKKKKHSKKASVIAKKVKKKVKAKLAAKRHHRRKSSPDSDSSSSEHSRVRKKKARRKKSSDSESSSSDSSDAKVETKKKRKRKHDSSDDDRVSKKSKLEKKKKNVKRKRKASSSSEYSSSSSDSSSDSEDYKRNKKHGRTGDKKVKRIRK